MSEYTMHVTVCDRCYAEELPAFTYFPLESIKGIFRGPRDDAYAAGWEERDYGDACPDCVTLEAEESADGEVLLGAAAAEAIGKLGERTDEPESDGS